MQEVYAERMAGERFERESLPAGAAHRRVVDVIASSWMVIAIGGVDHRGRPGNCFLECSSPMSI